MPRWSVELTFGLISAPFCMPFVLYTSPDPRRIYVEPGATFRRAPAAHPEASRHNQQRPLGLCRCKQPCKVTKQTGRAAVVPSGASSGGASPWAERRAAGGRQQAACFPAVPGLLVQCPTHPASFRGSSGWCWSSPRVCALRWAGGRGCAAVGGRRRRWTRVRRQMDQGGACRCDAACCCAGGRGCAAVGGRRRRWTLPADVMLPAVPGLLVQCPTHPASLAGWWWSRRRRSDLGCLPMRRCQVCLGCLCSSPPTQPHRGGAQGGAGTVCAHAC